MEETEDRSQMGRMTVARVRVPDDVWHDVRVAAAQRRQSIQEYVADVLRSATRPAGGHQSPSQMAH